MSDSSFERKNFEIKSNKGKEIIKDIFNTGIIMKKNPKMITTMLIQEMKWEC